MNKYEKNMYENATTQLKYNAFYLGEYRYWLRLRCVSIVDYYNDCGYYLSRITVSCYIIELTICNRSRRHDISKDLNNFGQSTTFVGRLFQPDM